MTEDTVVRRARAEDIHALSDLAIRTFRDTYADDNDPKTIEDYLRSSLNTTSLRNELNEAGNVFLIAFRRSDNVAIGYAKLRTTSEDPSVESQRAVEIERIYADKRVIGHGVGAALMGACLKTAGELECEAIWLGVWKRNQHAVLFYERWEFRTVGSRQFALGNELQDDLVMVRQLPSSIVD